MEKFDLKTATIADLYAAKLYCSEKAELLRQVGRDDAWEQSTLYSILAGHISREINGRLVPHIEQIKADLLK